MASTNQVTTKNLSTLPQKASRGRFATQKAKELKAAARDSMGVRMATKTFAFQLQIVIRQIEFTESQVKQINEQIAQQMEKLNSVVMTIPGVGPATDGHAVG